MLVSGMSPCCSKIAVTALARSLQLGEDWALANVWKGGKAFEGEFASNRG